MNRASVQCPTVRSNSLSRNTFFFFTALLVSCSLRAADISQSSSANAAQGLIERLLPGKLKYFILQDIPAENGHDVFEVESRDGKIILRGNDGVSMGAALNWYLKKICHCDISWTCGDQLNLPDPLPAVAAKVRIISPYRFRYAYNFCTHGYTMAWWNWPKWERELDFLALNGVNLALIIEGQESVWIQTLKNFGYSDAEARAWLVMPSHQPWMYMDNMESYGGPMSPELVRRRLVLARQILARMRELGIEPVLPGYYGMVPPDFKKRFPASKVHEQGNWGVLRRPDILDPTDAMFTEVSQAFYSAQHDLFGGANFYAADPFHEGGSTADIDIPAAGRAILAAMHGATWVLQSWQANPRQDMIDALDKNRLLVLDLFCEDHENWRERNNFNGTPWLWCTIDNFGGNVDMGGRLAAMGEDPVKAGHDPGRGRMSGIGALMEGTGANPVLWELFLENAWRSNAPDFPAWLNDYARRRYGAESPAASEAWKILAETIYNAPRKDGEYPVNSVVCARPSLNPDQRARAWAGTRPYYDTSKLVTAWKDLLDAAPLAGSSDGYRFDLCDLGRQVLANLATDYHKQIIAAYKTGDAQALRQLSEKMPGLIRDMDELVGTRKEFLLGTWLSDARSWGADKTEKDLCERDARELLTVWTSSDSITDYANRQWNGLLGDFYFHRWQIWLDALNRSLADHVALDETTTRNRIRDWELNWTHQTDGPFATKPHGDVIAISTKLFAKYGDEAAGITGHLENQSIAWNWRLADGKLRAVRLDDKLNGISLPFDGECFQLVLSNETVLKSSDFTLTGAPKMEILLPDMKSPVLARHFPGRQLVADFLSPTKNLAAEWRVILRDGSTYLRQELHLRALGQDVPIKSIVLLEETIPGAQTVGAVDGSPVVAGNFFFGYEHPMAQNTVSDNSLVVCRFLRNAALNSGEALTQSCVLGVTPAGQLRRGFLTYLERERAHPYRAFLHYNSWYDIAWVNRKYDAAECLNAINRFGDELVEKRGVKLDSFLFDDGWDDNRTLWNFHSGFPDGFTPLKTTAQHYGAGIGVWLSPFGGYGEAKEQRLAYGSRLGFETNTSGFSLAGPKYYQRFHDICSEMVQKYGVNQFKFDGMAANARANEAGLTRDGDAMLRLIAGLRHEKADLYINQTTGTWPSPFWLLYVDSTWRGGADHSFAGKGSWCQQWMTYRDAQTYQNVVERGPLYPLSSLMLHGIIYATNAVHLNIMSDADFTAQVREFFGNGTQLQEMYLTPQLLNEKNWNVLAEAAKWARSNADVLSDTHWVGGDPGKGEIYGWASWNSRKAILLLRNPDDKPASFTADIAKLFELPAGAKSTYRLHSPWKQDQGTVPVNVRAGKPFTFHLQPFELLSLES